MEFTIKNNVITAYGTINDGDGIEFSKQFSELEKIHQNIILKIHTYGGSVFDGNLIYNTLIDSLADVEIHIVGIAASMGAVISLACQKVLMVENGYIMIHAPSGGTQGTATDHENNIKLLRSIETNFLKKLSEKTGKPETYFNPWLIGDNWFDANQALSEGLITGILTAETKIKGTFDPTKIGVKEVYNRFSALFDNNYNLNKTSMLREKLISKFNLSANTSDTAILNKIDEETSLLTDLITLLKLKPESTPDEVLARVEELLQAEEDTKGEQTIEANFLIAEAIKKGKIVHGQKKHIENMFKSNFSGAKEFLKNSPERVTIISMIKNEVSTGKNDKKDQSEWGLDEYRMYAPKELEANPELYKTLLQNKFKK